MKKLNLSLLGVAAQLALTNDAAFTYRMGAGSPGEVNRTHPASIEAVLTDVTNPPLFYGCAVLVNTASNGVRNILAGDTGVTTIYGVLTRPFPVQQTSGGMNSALGAATPPTTGIQDVVREGYVLVKVVGAPTKKGPVYVWVAASSGNHVQGGFEAASGGASTILLTNAWFNGPADSSGICELQVAVAN